VQAKPQRRKEQARRYWDVKDGGQEGTEVRCRRSEIGKEKREKEIAAKRHKNRKKGGPRITRICTKGSCGLLASWKLMKLVDDFFVHELHE